MRLRTVLGLTFGPPGSNGVLPIGSQFMALMDSLLDSLRGGGGSRRTVGSFQDVLDVADGLEEYMDLLTTVAAKVQNAVPPRATTAQDIKT